MIKIGLTDFTPANKIITIRDKNQQVKALYSIGANDILKSTLMNEHYIEIYFELNSNVSFKRSDYIEWEGDKYTLRNDYLPEQINKRKYKYTLRFEAVEMLFLDVQYYYLNQSLKESEWRLIGNPDYFIQIAVDNINRYFGTTDYTIGTIEPTETKDILFETDTNTFDALTQIAEAYNAEWYVTGKTIHLLNKVSFGNEIAFETEVSVLSMQREDSANSEKYTRILALGSTRNIPKDYRQTTPNESVDAIYPKRLRIPVSKGDVIDAYPGMVPDEVIEGTVIFDEVYPKRVGTIEAVGTIEYTETDEETGIATPWNAYKFKDSGIDFKEEYVLPGEELRLSFQSGDLNGFDFALVFHKSGFSGSDNSQYFEIVRSEDYGKALPNDILKPKAGDKYVLYGFNIALVSDQYVPAAELELYNTALEWLQKQLQDNSVYECATVIRYFAENQMDLAIGQNVKLVNVPFDSDNRSSRIMGFEKKLNNKFDAVYTVGDNPAYSRLSEIEKEIKELQHAGIVYENTGGNSVYIIKQFDTTRPSDFNVYSAVASNARYFNKQTGDTVKGNTVFEKNLQVQGLSISDVFQNSTFTAGQLGSGFQIKRDANGQSYMEVDNLLVRREAVFNRLTIAEIKSVGGAILLSLANMLVSAVEDTGTSWKCYFDNDNGTIPNDFTVGDQAICRKYNGTNIKYYWALVTAAGSNYIELSKTDKDGIGIPGIDDEVVQLGNRTDVNRQYAIMLSAYGSDAPSIKQYAGINNYDLTGKEVTAITPAGNKFTGSFTVSTNGTTAPVYKERGLFVNGTVYYLNDRVSHLGSYWVCIVNSTVTTPSETSITWRKETAGQTDINNAVNNIQIGARNLLIQETSTPNALVNHLTGALETNIYHHSTDFIPVSTYKQLTFSNSLNRNFYYPRIVFYDTNKAYLTGTLYDAFLINTSVVDVPAGAAFMRFSTDSRTQYTPFDTIKIESGNKATDWTPAPEDIQGEITQIESNLTVLNDKIESKVSQTVFDALGSRVSTAESDITQQATQITSLVNKTGVNNLGVNETLYSKITQTAEQITLEVNNIQIGARNLLIQGTSTPNALVNHLTGALETNIYHHSTDFIPVSTYKQLIFSNSLNRNFYYPRIVFYDTNKAYLTGTLYDAFLINTSVVDVPAGAAFMRFSTDSRTQYTPFDTIKIESGNKATDWTPAPEDIPDMVGSSLTLTDNKISLASNTIELTGTTIADAIKAESLNVGDNFLVDTDGKITAVDCTLSGKMALPFLELDNITNGTVIDLSQRFNIVCRPVLGLTVYLPIDDKYNGVTCHIFNNIPPPLTGYSITVKQQNNATFGGSNQQASITIGRYRVASFIGISNYMGFVWACVNAKELE